MVEDRVANIATFEQKPSRVANLATFGLDVAVLSFTCFATFEETLQSYQYFDARLSPCRIVSHFWHLGPWRTFATFRSIWLLL